MSGGRSISIVVRSKDEADRLRLTLASLSRQDHPAEIVVVDDGSCDHTPAVIGEAATAVPIVRIRHDQPRGRSGAANAGARAASGEIVVFLDGDTLAGPGFTAAHAALHMTRPGSIGRGETFHLRCTRFLLDPEAASPRPGEAERLARMKPDEIERLKVTRRQVLDDFAAVEARADAGIYPGAGPRRLQALELDALRNHPDCEVLWAAASGANLSVPREDFLAVGGFDETIDINEHRELALRLCQAGLRMALAEGARSYHLTHRTGWRDPLVERSWEAAFHAAHPIPAVGLLAVFWASVTPGGPLPAEARIDSLPALAAAARGESPADYAAARAALGLPPLSAPAHA